MIERKRSLVPAPSHELTPYVSPPEADGSDARPSPGGAAPKHDDGKDVPPPPRKRVALYVGVAVAALLGWGAWGHWQTHSAAAETQQQQQDFRPEVHTVEAKRVTDPVQLMLPGQTEAFDTANLSARSTGFVAERKVDIGSRVHKGDLLLRISAPDLDQQLVQAQAQVGQNQAVVLQAQAALQQAQANVGLANVTKYRETTLANQGWETRQNADNSTANAKVNAAGVVNAQAGIAVAEANLKAQQATVQRLQELSNFEQITAPFDGVITARNVDTGDLVTADNGSATPLLSIQRDNVLRVAVYVPQSGAVGIRDGLDAEVTVPEIPGHTFRAHVSRSAHALDPTARSMLTEVDVDNSDGILRPGLFVNVNFSIPRSRPGVVIPAEAIVFNAGGLQVATVEDGDQVHYRKINIYRDFGTTAELQDGLDGDEKLILTPPAGLADGSKVRLAGDHPDKQPDGGAKTSDGGDGKAVGSGTVPQQDASR